MNLLEAIQCRGDNWFRPKGHRQYGLSFSGGGLLRLHERINGRIITRDYQFDCIQDFEGEWELLEPNSIISEAD